MFRNKRHKDAYDLYDFFFNKHKLIPTNRCCNCIIESRFQQGLVDEALDFHRSIKYRGYPNDDTLRANLVLDEFKRAWSAFALSSSWHKPDSLSLEYEQRLALLMATFMEYWFKQGKEMEAMKCYEPCVGVANNNLPPDTGNALLKILLKYCKKTHAWALYHDMFDQSQSGISSRPLDSGTVKIMVGECFDMGRCSQAIDTYNKARAKNNFLDDR
ncbi:pentatricopeptide repeat-containing protein At3g60980, mitochondrial-like [Brassica napus]|uniref:pentatricopeptide repeat-containing protein At3g60980, mitochondrial-like n=1 Tax=Brassica napus TaxID=3708 RepID=UPI00207ABD45|nr:pentatricopeptide repeat-containing protein At3g60980, mitochondrial-like [Brassica napus]